MVQRNSPRVLEGYAGSTPVGFGYDPVDQLIATAMRDAFNLGLPRKTLQTRIEKLAAEAAGSGIVARVITVEFLE